MAPSLTETKNDRGERLERMRLEVDAMQSAELLALRAQWRRISNDARAEFRLLSERNPEQSGSFSTTPVQTTKVGAASFDAYTFLLTVAQVTPVRLSRGDVPVLQLPTLVRTANAASIGN